MSYQWTQVPFLNVDRSIESAPGVVFGHYSVGPVKMMDDTYSSAAFRVGCAVTGLRIAEYTDFKVAVNFACYLERHYGDLSEANGRYINGIYSAADNRIFLEIADKRKHVTFRTEKLVEYIKFDPSQYGGQS